MPSSRQKTTSQQRKKTEGLEFLRERLLEQREELLNMYRRDVRVGQESADNGTEDIVDRANNSYNRELMFSLSDAERAMLIQIEAALERFQDGTYGKCEHCGREITPQRLQAIPWAKHCIDCQELEEKGLLRANE